MKEDLKGPYGVLLSRLATSSLSPAEYRVCWAILKATLVDEHEGIEYNLHSMGLVTGLEKRRVDTAIGALLTKKLLRLNKATNMLFFGAITVNVRQYNNNTVKHVKHVKKLETATVGVKAPKTTHDNPLRSLLTGISARMPHVDYQGNAYLIEATNIKRLYKKFFLAFPWSNSQYQAMGLVRDYLDYKLDTDQWFRNQANLPFTYLYKHVDGYIAGIKPKSRDDLVEEQISGRRLRWNAKDRTYEMILKDEQ